MQMLKDKIKRLLLSSVIPSMDDFDLDDQKLINDWLLMSSGHKGFYTYLKARDRAHAQSIVDLDPKDKDLALKKEFLDGGRMEIVRLKARAEKIKRLKDSNSS